MGRSARVAFPSSSSRHPLATIFVACLALSLAVGAALVTSVISAAPASAHAVLGKIAPAANGRLTSAPTNVVLDFNEPISTTFATVVVIGPAGVSVAQGKPAILGGKVTQALSPSLASGGYLVAFRVTSDDGHPVTGQSKFTLTLATGSASATASAAASTTAPVAVDAPPSVADQNAGQASWLSRYLAPVAGALGLLAVGLGVLAWERRRH